MPRRVERGLERRIDKAIGDRLLKAALHQCFLKPRQCNLSFRLRRHLQAGQGPVARQLVITMHAGDFFNQIHLQANIEAATGRNDPPMIDFNRHCHAQPSKDVLDFSGRNVQTQQQADSLRPQPDRRLRR